MTGPATRSAPAPATAPVVETVSPGCPYGFGTLQSAQALGDLQARADRHRPVLHLHLADRTRGLATLLRAVGGRP